MCVLGGGGPEGLMLRGALVQVKMVCVLEGGREGGGPDALMPHGALI